MVDLENMTWNSIFIYVENSKQPKKYRTESNFEILNLTIRVNNDTSINFLRNSIIRIILYKKTNQSSHHKDDT